MNFDTLIFEFFINKVLYSCAYSHVLVIDECKLKGSRDPYHGFLMKEVQKETLTEMKETYDYVKMTKPYSEDFDILQKIQ